MDRRLVRRPVVLCILDGVGLGAGGEDDAVATARTPTLDHLKQTCPWLALEASGPSVGLPSASDMGNSEVGHNAMGAGRVIEQGASLVQRAIATGSLFETELWRDLVRCPVLHLLGLVSDGNVHSHIDHLRALIARAVRDGVRKIRIHALTDGRDVGRKTALTWFVPLEAELAALAEQGVDAAIASGGGRMFLTMDRYQADWSMVARGWEVHVHGRARGFASAIEAIETYYAEDPATDDQWLPGFVTLDAQGQPKGVIADGDGVLCFNFRGDRVIEICRAFEEGAAFDAFDRGRVPSVIFGGMMLYDGDIPVPKRFLVPPPLIENPLGHWLANAGKTTFACAETQKFGHVTYFFNGNRSHPISEELETWQEVPSDVRPFDSAPWMKAAEVTDAVLEALASGGFDHLRLNYANGDMVGHTGNLEATRIAVESVDLQLARLLEGVRRADGVLIVTADHGNADEMWQHDKAGGVLRESDGAPLAKTSHTLARVPCIVFDARGTTQLRDELDRPGISSLGGTVLDLLGLPVPEGWSPSLLAR